MSIAPRCAHRIVLPSCLIALLLIGCTDTQSFDGRRSPEIPLAQPTPPAADPAPTSPAPVTVISTNAVMVPAAGGTAASQDGELMLTIPAGALPEDTEITISEIELEDVAPEFDGLVIDRAFELGPSGLQFAAPITVEVAVEGNPLRADGAIVLDTLLGLVTLENGSPMLLDDTAPRVVVGASGAAVSVVGRVDHFSPLLVQRLTTTPFEELVISGFPPGGRGIVGETYDLLFSVETQADDLTQNGSDRVSFEYAPNGAGAAVFVPTDLGEDGLVPLPQDFTDELPDEVSVFIGTSRHLCQSAAESGPWGGRLRLDSTVVDPSGPVSDEFPNEALAAQTLIDLLEPTTRAYEPFVEREVGCIEPAPPTEPEPDPQPQLGIFAIPGLAGAVEAITVLSRLVGAVQAYTQLVQLLIGDGAVGALISGQGGSVGIDLADGSVALDGASEDGATTFGAVAVVSEGGEDAILFSYGPNGPFGGFTSRLDQETGEFFSFGQLASGGFTDASTSCEGQVLCDELITVSNDVCFVGLSDGAEPVFSENAGRSCIASSELGFRQPITAAAREAGGGVIIATTTDLWFADGSGDPPERLTPTGFATDPAGSRRLRCGVGSPLCALTLFDAQQIIPIVWPGTGTPLLRDPISVPGGSVGIDLRYDPETNETCALTTGFTDGTVHRSCMDGDGNLLDQIVRDVPEGCDDPGYAAYHPDATTRSGFYSGTCFSSNNYYTGRIEDDF